VGSAGRIALGALALLAAAAVAPGSAFGAALCEEPFQGDWTDVAPADAGMDAAKLQAAIDFASANQGQAVRVYRYGCRVGEDGLAALNRGLRFQSFSFAKSVTALVFGRAMTRHLISPDDPLGALIPAADAAHGKITMRDLLTMTSGLAWNGLRDYNIFMPNRLQEALTVPVEKPPGTYWEYSQSGPALVAAATESAVGEDFQAFAQRRLFGPLGIEEGTWTWTRDDAGATQGFFGLHMVPDDFARFGELMRRGGVWRGRRLLSKRFVAEAITPVEQSGCYGYFIWLNASKPCVLPRITERPVSDDRLFPSLPADAYQFAGLLGQLVTVFPSQGLVVARFGSDNPAGSNWEEDFYGRVLDSIVDEPVERPKPAPDAGSVSRDDVDRGFQDSLARPQDVLEGEVPPPLPPAGPARARATEIEPRSARPTRDGRVTVKLRCPPAWPAALPRSCRGTARITGAKRVAYRIRARKARTVSFQLREGFLHRLERKRRTVTVVTRNRDRAQGARAALRFVLRPR
jgi:CubicO group peptidase (beta-lactamase class C family)